MARKLKSDRVLFTATVLVVCASVVMVYSASAVVALERFDQPYLFLTKQALWSVLGVAVLAISSRIDYRTYRNDAFIWALLAAVGLMLVGVMFSSQAIFTSSDGWMPNPPTPNHRRVPFTGELNITPTSIRPTDASSAQMNASLR